MLDGETVVPETVDCGDILEEMRRWKIIGRRFWRRMDEMFVKDALCKGLQKIDISYLWF